jgi:predicted Zn-ribbon and HTH transcriptional regulator
MTKLDIIFNKLIIESTVRAMLDPNNEYFYLPNLTLGKVATLCNGEDDKTFCFWQAYKIASREFAKQQAIKEAQEQLNTLDKNVQVYHDPNCCPECGYGYYQGYVKCPNCDYVE